MKILVIIFSMLFSLFASANTWFHYTMQRGPYFISFDYQVITPSDMSGNVLASPLWINIHSRNLGPQDRVDLEISNTSINPNKMVARAPYVFWTRLIPQAPGHFSGLILNGEGKSSFPLRMQGMDGIYEFVQQVGIRVNSQYITDPSTLSTEMHLDLWNFYLARR